MTNLTIDRLTLKLSGLSPHQGQQLAQLVTQRLAHASLPPASTPDLDRLTIQITAQPHDNLDRCYTMPAKDTYHNTVKAALIKDGLSRCN